MTDIEKERGRDIFTHSCGLSLHPLMNNNACIDNENAIPDKTARREWYVILQLAISCEEDEWIV